MARPLRRPGNLPAEATSFIGRRGELAEIRRRLAEARLVTLAGPGGVGKTRLAIRAAMDLSRGFTDGVWLVELAEVRDLDLLGKAVLTGLDLRDQAVADPHELVFGHLRGKQLLLVLDNCEHLRGPVAQLVAKVIRTAPGVRVLATSREPLSAPGEQVLAVPPLELPEAGMASGTAQSEAVSLFVDRAAAASGFQLTAATHEQVVDLTRRLDGLPLAIELAAVRTRVLSVGEIVDRLSDRFSLLTGGADAAVPRHQTLRTTIDWSHDLLSAAERALLRRVSVFGGRFALEDLEAVCVFDEVEPPAALDVLSSLVDKSLVLKQEVGGRAVFRLHETMREYAALKLREAGEEEELRRRCTDHYRWRAGVSGQEARFHLPEWLEWVDLEIDNIRGVLRDCLARGEHHAVVGLALSLSWYWATRATSEGVRWLDAALYAETAAIELKGWGFFMRGFLALLQAESSAARLALLRAAAIARETGQSSLLVHALAMASIAENIRGDRAAAKLLIGQAKDAAGGLEDVTAVLSFLQAQSMDGLFAGDAGAIRPAAVEGIRLAREAGDLYSLAHMHMNLGLAELFDGNFTASNSQLTDALRIASLIDDRVGQAYELNALGCLAAATGEASHGARLLGAGETMRKAAAAHMYGFFDPLLTQAESAARAKLGDARFEAEFAAGARLVRTEAVALALGERGEDADRSAAPALLAGRQMEVARLVAEGLGNKQIAARLFISEHTVDSHVRSIFNKLGVNSRAQVAARMSAPQAGNRRST